MSKPSLVVFVLVSSVVVGVLLNTEPLNAQGSKPKGGTEAKSGTPSKSNAPDDGLPFVKTCKAATGLVNRREYGSGSAFCISTEGYFLTNRHVVEGLKPGETVEVVMNAGEKTEKILKAKLLHVSEEERVDLAILKTDPSKELTALGLGDDSKLQETAAVTAFGFPFGRSLASNKNQFPNVTVTSGRISALRRNDNVMEAIQVDAAINPGCSGGPLVDRQGKVIGVVFAAIPLSGISFAVPVSRVKDYIKAPHIMVSMPNVRYSERHNKHRIAIELVEMTPSPKPVSMELTLQGEDTAPRTVPLQRNGSTFEAQVELFTKPTSAPPLTLKVWRGKVSTLVQVPDQSVQFGAKRLLLSECRLVQRRPDAHLITTLDGEKFAASTNDLPQVKSEGGEIDLKLADRIQVFSSDEANGEISVEVVAKRDGKQIATNSGKFRCSGMPHHGAGEFLADPNPDELPPGSMTIDAVIDGRSTLFVAPNGLFWQHHEGTLPACPDGTRSAVMLNGRKWPLAWQRDFDGDMMSTHLPLKLGTTFYDAKLLSLRDRPDGPHNTLRGAMSLEKPSFDDNTLKISLRDTAAGAGHFRLHLRPNTHWKIPEPVAPRLKPPTSARWTFDDDRSELIQDATGNQHVGHGPFPTIVPGKIGNSLALDVGSVNCGNIGDFEKTDAFSMGGWAWINSGTVFHEVCGRMDGRVGFRGHDLAIYGDKLGFQLFHDAHARNGLVVMSAELLNTFRWYHVFATYDGSGNTSGIRMYIDGAPAEFVVQMEGLTGTTRLNVPFRIGHREVGSPNAEPMHGMVDEIRLYSRVLRPDEVLALATLTKPGPSPTEPASLRDKLVGAWSFDDIKQEKLKPTIVHDSGPNKHHGTIEFKDQDVTFEAGKFGKAVKLNNRVIQFGPETGDFERTDAFSVGCWVRRTNKPNQGIISKLEQRSPFRGYDLMIQNGKPRIGLGSVWDGGQEEPARILLVVGTDEIPADQWHHVMATCDGSSKASGVTLYVDGQPAKSKIDFDKLDGSIRTVAPLCLGNRFSDPGGAYDGLIDEAVIYARCLTADEVRSLVAGKPPAP